MVDKRVPELRFEGFDGDWEQRKLGNLATFSKGNGYTKNELQESGDPIILYGRLYTKYETVINNVDTFVIKKEKSVISEGNEVIVPASGESAKDISRASVIDTAGLILGGDLNIIRPNENINPVFLALTISNGSQQREMSKRAQGKSVVHLHNSDLKEVNLLYPSLKEQKQIGLFFKQLDTTTALHQQKLDQLKRLKQGFLQILFGNKEQAPKVRFAGFDEEWEQRKLGNITESFSGGTPTAGKSEYYGGDIPFIRSGEISSELTELFITENGLNSSSAKMVKVGDILYALYGATSGEVSISRINGAINQAILAIRPTKNDNSYLIVQWLRKQKDTIISTYLQGGQGNLSGSIVKDLVITLPQDREEQNKISTFFKQLDDTINLHQTKLEKLKQLKKAFLQKMFI
ncbi:restriction endonuclease subunit S [Enterococcus thailandicus]|uniref:restriction endonuclease subunit S n=1 Tax=Enterococcus thailandicus TaxID=417368 RepID=UPI0028927E90|nr:restriction endonuclease subunit S [Enterococcus thailandicus]MDT2845600.1 restriction endonuclease subunit S [Enterococcus thailandicus]